MKLRTPYSQKLPLLGQINIVLAASWLFLPTLKAQTPPTGSLLVWLKADAGVALSATNVVSWTNQITNGIVFSAPTTPTRPTLATNVVNGLPVVRFDGARQLTANLGRQLTNATIFTLCQFTVASSDNDYLYALGIPQFSGSMMSFSRRSGDKAYHYDGSVQVSPETTLPPFTFQVFSQVYGEGGPQNHQLYQNLLDIIDSQASTPYSVNASNAALGAYYGGGFNFVGDIVEWLVYDRALDMNERRQVEEYLRQRAALSPFFAAGSLDLSNWEIIQYEVNAQPDAQWVLKLANRQLDQFINADPSIYLSPFAIANQTIHSRMGSGSAPDTMGFVFGYQDRGHYYLFDWKKTTASYQNFGTQPAGMRLRVMHVPGGQDPTGADFWSAPDTNRSTTLTNNSLPWVDGVDYDLVLRLHPGQIELEVYQGTTNLVSWTVNDNTYPSGRFGYYDSSLENVRFGQIVLESVSPLITNIQRTNNTNVSLTWINGLPPFQVQGRTNLTLGNWLDVGGETTNQNQTVTSPSDASFYRVRGAAVPP